MSEKKRSKFSGKMGYVLSAAGASVGLGNIWRFPCLAAKYGGGAFVLTYIILAVTFGYTMIMSESALGRMTRKSPIGAFLSFDRGPLGKVGGFINAIIPMLIVPYYSVIGGWVFKYMFEFVRGNGAKLAEDGTFTAFVGDWKSVVFWFILFSACTLIVIYAGVKNGIEKVSTFMMPILIVLAVIIAVYSMTRPGAFAGVQYLLVPNFSNFSWMTVVAALGQMFYSLSIAMGILITFGSYMHTQHNLETATFEVEVCDSLVAILSGLMVIPSVFAFSGGDTNAVLQSGPSLMFVTLPKVFASMGLGGMIIGILFFVLVLFAALTSSIALTESCVSTFEDEFHWNRQQGVALMAVVQIGLGLLSCLGFNILSGVTPFKMDILSFFDFLTNSVMMPIAAILICLLILVKVGIPAIEKEVSASSNFRMKKVYEFVLKYFAIAFVVIILVSSILQVLGIINI